MLSEERLAEIAALNYATVAEKNELARVYALYLEEQKCPPDPL